MSEPKRTLADELREIADKVNQEADAKRKEEAKLLAMGAVNIIILAARTAASIGNYSATVPVEKLCVDKIYHTNRVRRDHFQSALTAELRYHGLGCHYNEGLDPSSDLGEYLVYFDGNKR